MSQRLDVLFEEAELEEIRRAALREGLTVTEWVRLALREAWSRESRHSVEEKLAALEHAMQHDFPTGDMDRILAEIGAGHLDHR